VSTDEPRVVVVVTAGCHLCEEASEVVSAVCAETDIAWVARDLLTLDDDSIARWREYVPVVLIDGAVHDVFRVTAERLRAALLA
jgi:hypothetical protein